MKAYTKGAKRRAKKAKLPDLASVPKKQPNGRTRRKAGELAERNPTRTVMEARARQTSGKVADMNNPAFCEPAGQAIYAFLEPDCRKDAWDAYAGLTLAEAVYHKHYTGQKLHAKTAKIEMAPERFEARADVQPDLRTEEERSKDAANRGMRWRGYLMQLRPEEQKAILDAAYGRVAPMDAGLVTGAGERLAYACDRLAEKIRSKELTYRNRTVSIMRKS